MAGEAHDADLIGHADPALTEQPQRAEALHIHRCDDGVETVIGIQQPGGALVAIFKGVGLPPTFAEDGLQPAAFHSPKITLSAQTVRGQILGAVDDADAPAAEGVQVSHGVVAAGLIICHDAADGGILVAHQLDEGDSLGADVPQKTAVAARGSDDDAVDKPVAQAIQAIALHSGVVLSDADHGGIAALVGLLLDALEDLGKDRQMQPGHHHAEDMPPPLAQSLGHGVGPVAQGSRSFKNPRPGVGMDVGGVVQRPGDGAHVHTGKFCHIF